MTSQRFIDTRTGEIVTQVPISEIAHFEEYNGTALHQEFVCKACRRPELDCSKQPCEAVKRDRGELMAGVGNPHERFAARVLAHLESEDEWSADTLDFIAATACDLGLADPKYAVFRLTEEGRA